MHSFLPTWFEFPGALSSGNRFDILKILLIIFMMLATYCEWSSDQQYKIHKILYNILLQDII
jgi:hypothetical protein